MQTIDLHNCYRNHIEYGAGCDYWCMPVNQGDQGDQEKTPTPMKMNVNMGTKDFYQQALNSQVDQLFFGSMPPSSDQTPSPCTVTGTSKCSRFIFGHDEIN